MANHGRSVARRQTGRHDHLWHGIDGVRDWLGGRESANSRGRRACFDAGQRSLDATSPGFTMAARAAGLRRGRRRGVEHRDGAVDSAAGFRLVMPNHRLDPAVPFAWFDLERETVGCVGHRSSDSRAGDDAPRRRPKRLCRKVARGCRIVASHGGRFRPRRPVTGHGVYR